MLLNLIHLRKNYSSIDALLSDGLDGWSCRSWGKRTLKRSLRGSAHHLHCAHVQSPALSPCRVSMSCKILTKLHGGICRREEGTLSWRKAPLPPESAGLWTELLSGDLEPSTKTNVWPPALEELFLLKRTCGSSLQTGNVQSTGCHLGHPVLSSRSMAWIGERPGTVTVSKGTTPCLTNALLTHRETSSRP